jgi:hypothetical protein
MEFDLEGFVDDPTIEKLDGCTVEHLKLIAGRYSVDVSKYGRKPVIKERLRCVLAARGAISPRESDEAGFNEQIRMKELELELRRLELKEREISFSLRGGNFLLVEREGDFFEGEGDHLPFRGEEA